MTSPFDPNVTTYNHEAAKVLCDASRIAYSDEATCRAWAIANGFKEDFQFIDTSHLDPMTDTQGFVAQSPDVLLVVFRGTEPRHIADVTSDADAIRFAVWDKSNLGEVHGGFFRAFFAAWGKLFGGRKVFPDMLRNAAPRKIWITGHSLGGALAQICAAQTALRDAIPVHAVYTFGQPRVGDEQFAGALHAALGARTYRLVNNQDIVPRVPFFTMRYRHFGQELFFSPKGQQGQSSSVENISAALESLRLLSSLPTIASALTGLLGGLLSGDPHTAFLTVEKTLDPRSLLKPGTVYISDHLMESGYSKLFQDGTP